MLLVAVNKPGCMMMLRLRIQQVLNVICHQSLTQFKHINENVGLPRRFIVWESQIQIDFLQRPLSLPFSSFNLCLLLLLMFILEIKNWFKGCVRYISPSNKTASHNLLLYVKLVSLFIHSFRLSRRYNILSQKDVIHGRDDVHLTHNCPNHKF